jgi:hypothetical protein
MSEDDNSLASVCIFQSIKKVLPKFSTIGIFVPIIFNWIGIPFYLNAPGGIIKERYTAVEGDPIHNRNFSCCEISFEINRIRF